MKVYMRQVSDGTCDCKRPLRRQVALIYCLKFESFLETAHSITCTNQGVFLNSCLLNMLLRKELNTDRQQTDLELFQVTERLLRKITQEELFGGFFDYYLLAYVTFYKMYKCIKTYSFIQQILVITEYPL